MVQLDEIEKEAKALFSCEKDILQYLVESAGSIGPSKFGSQAKKK